MNPKILALCLALGCAAPLAHAADDVSENHVAGMIDLISKPDEKHRPQQDSGLGLDLRYGNGGERGWGYEVRAFYARLKLKDAATHGNRGGFGADGVYRLSSMLGMTPYFVAGGGLVYNDALPGRDWIAPMVNLGAGVVSGALAHIGGRPLRLRGEFRYSYEDYRDEYTGSTVYDRSNYLDRHFYLGLELGLLKPPPPPAPAPVAVVAPVEPPPPPPPADTDGDGVMDADDACAGSPAGKPVDARGCTVLTLSGVTFDTGSARLTPASLAVLDTAATTLTTDFPAAHIEVSGHTDNAGDDARNLDLSRRRAQAVRAYLTAHGVSQDRLTAEGYGAAKPVASNDTPEGRAENRRVELHALAETAPAPAPAAAADAVTAPEAAPATPAP